VELLRGFLADSHHDRAIVRADLLINHSVASFRVPHPFVKILTNLLFLRRIVVGVADSLQRSDRDAENFDPSRMCTFYDLGVSGNQVFRPDQRSVAKQPTYAAPLCQCELSTESIPVLRVTLSLHHAHMPRDQLPAQRDPPRAR
jgi:hypothetical protein